MAIREFPPVEFADADGLLAVGGDLEVESLLLAYRSGIFPWPVDEDHLTWFAPAKRAVLFFKDFYVSRTLRKELRRNEYEFTIDRNFDEIIEACSELTNRGHQTGTWITGDIIDAYKRFHQAGYAHSIECYENNNLIGGLYGVCIGRMFAGESMFYRKSNASKLALAYLVEYLEARGLKWMDCQVMNPFLESLGAIQIDRKEFSAMLAEVIDSPDELF